MAQITPEFPVQGEVPWGNKLNTALSVIVDGVNARVEGNGVNAMWVGTQAEYDAVSPKLSTTLYFVRT